MKTIPLEKTLEEVGGSEIMMGILLLKPDRNPFQIEDLRRRFDETGKKYSRLEGFTDDGGMIDNFFFFFNQYLYYDFSLPHYRLSDDGVKVFQEEFDSYPPQVRGVLREVAKEFWDD